MVCWHGYDFTYSYAIICRPIWFLDGTITGTTNWGQRGPESNGNEGVHHTPKNSPRYLGRGGVTSSAEDAVVIF